MWRSSGSRRGKRGVVARLSDVMVEKSDRVGENVVTGLEPAKRGTDRLNVYLDGHFLGTVADAYAYQQRLTVGVTLSPEAAADLRRVVGRQAHLDAAMHYLTFRPRSEQELRRFFAHRQVDDATAEAVMGDLRRLGLVNDEAFARFWSENRQRFRPRGARLLRHELRTKGIASETLDALAGEEGQPDQETLACAAAEKVAQRWVSKPWPEFRKSLGAYLVRRGFEYEVVSAVTRRLWEQREPRSDDEAGC